jgi:hypothetical protein
LAAHFPVALLGLGLEALGFFFDLADVFQFLLFASIALS